MTEYSIAVVVIALGAALGLGAVIASVVMHIKQQNAAKNIAPIPTDDKTLALEKLQLEVRELRTSPGRVRAANLLVLTTASLAATTTLAIALGGWLISIILQRDSDRKHDDDAYNAFIANLGSNNGAARIGAVIGLSTHIQPSDPREEQTVAILLARLSDDNDPAVTQEIVEQLSASGPTVVPQALDTQRQAYWLFDRYLGPYVVTRMFDACSRRRSDAGIPAALLKLGNSVYGVLPYGSNDIHPMDLGTMKWLNREVLNVPQEFCWQLRGTYQSWPQEYVVDSNPERVIGPLKELVGISSILSILIAKNAETLRSAGLRHAIILNLEPARYHALDLHGYHLESAYFAGHAWNVNLDGADLDGADLYGADMDSTTSFRGASLTGTTFNALELNTLALDNILPNFKGASWWRANLVKSDVDGLLENKLSPYGCNAVVIALRERYPIPGHHVFHC